MNEGPLEDLLDLHDPSTGKVHTFQLTGGPIDDPAVPPEVFALIGRFVCAWARLETQIELILLVLNRPEHSTADCKLFQARHPQSFSDRIALLDRYVNQHAALAEFKPLMVRVIDFAKHFAGKRNFLSHAILDYYHPLDKRVTLQSIRTNPFKKPQLQTKGYTVSTTVVYLHQIEYDLRDINEIAKAMVKFTNSAGQKARLGQLKTPV